MLYKFVLYFFYYKFIKIYVYLCIRQKKKITYLEEKDQMFLQFVFNKYLLLKLLFAIVILYYRLFFYIFK